MKYQIEIKGMHCRGCLNLIKISLEELPQTDAVAVQEGKAEFASDLEPVNVKERLDQIFTELPGYSYSNLKGAE